MKLLSNRGFMLVETLVVSVFTLTVLLFVFIQFQKLESSYASSIKYNHSDGLYAAANIRKYILNNGFETIRDDFLVSGEKYVDLSSCNVAGLTNSVFCDKLKETLNIKTIILIAENPNLFINDFRNIRDLSENLKEFTKYIKYDNDIGVYRIILEFEDATFATVKISEEM
jgi:hypothetical protein